jgi:hypothetical protein
VAQSPNCGEAGKGKKQDLTSVFARLVKYLNRKVGKYRRSHFCHFMLFLLAERLCEVV